MSEPRSRLSLVVNPASGHGRAGRAIPTVTAQLRAAAPTCELQVIAATSPEDSVAQCAAVVERADPDTDRLVVMGGDGMVHVGINACATTGVTLGVIPFGTGNDFARGLGLPRRVAGAVEVVAGGQVDEIDLTRVSSPHSEQVTWVGCTVSSGYDALVSQAANTSPLKLGPFAYPYHALKQLARFSALTYRLELDGHRRELQAMLIGVSNSSSLGGGMKLAPTADVHDGLLDVVIIHPMSRGTFLRLLPSVFSGRHLLHPKVELVRAATVVIDGDAPTGGSLMAEGDGEQISATPVTATSVPAALRLLRPAGQVG